MNAATPTKQPTPTEPRPKKPRYSIVFAASPDAVPEINRLRRLLKALLRGYGFRAINVEELPVEPSKETK
jgi:hypothetical protein